MYVKRNLQGSFVVKILWDITCLTHYISEFLNFNVVSTKEEMRNLSNETRIEIEMFYSCVYVLYTYRKSSLVKLHWTRPYNALMCFRLRFSMGLKEINKCKTTKNILIITWY